MLRVPDEIRARGALLATVALWAMAFPVIRVGVAGYGPVALSLLRLCVAAAVLAIVAPFLGVRLPSWKDLPHIALCGTTGMAGYNLLLNWGEVHVPAGTASFIVVTNPIYSAVIAVIFLGERVGSRQILGAAVALAGVAAIATAHAGLRLEMPALIVVGAAIVFGTYHAAIKPLLSRYSALEVTAYATWMGALLLTPAIPSLIAALPYASAQATASAVFLGVGPSALGFLTWSYAIGRLPVTVATGSLYLVPPFALLVGHVWLGETPGVIQLIGGAATIMGVAIANSRRPPAINPTARKEGIGLGE